MYTAQEQAEIVALFLENRKNVHEVQKAWRRRRGKHSEPPCYRTIVDLYNKFMETGSTADRHRSGRLAVGEAGVEAVRQEFLSQSSTSYRRVAQRTNLSYSAVRNVAQKQLGLYPHRVQLLYERQEQDAAKRLRFADWALAKLDDEANFRDLLFMTDECHVHLDGYVNSQNYRWHATVNSHVTVQRSAHPKRVTVWCAVLALSAVISLHIVGLLSCSPLSCQMQQYAALLFHADPRC